MSDRDPELERLFRAARREEGPTDDDRRAVRKAIAGRVAVAAAAGAAATLVPRAVAAAGGSLGKATIFGWFAAGLGAGATVGAVVTATLVLREKDERPDVVPSAVVTKSAPAPAPPVVSPPRVPADPVPEATVTATSTREKPESPPEATSASPSLEVETRALGEVTRALRDGLPEEALRRLAEQERSFARGALHEERAAARVFALCAAGRVAEARGARERFLAAYPQSPSADRVRASCPP